MLEAKRSIVLGGFPSSVPNIVDSPADYKGQKVGSGSDNVTHDSQTLVPEGKTASPTHNLSRATRKRGIVLHPENEPVRVSDSVGYEGCEAVPELNKTVERLSHFTPCEIEYFLNLGVRMDKAGAEMQTASYQAGELSDEMFRAGYYVCLYAHDLFQIPEVAAYRKRRAAQANKEMGF